MFEGKLRDEEGRLAALGRYEVLDTAPEKPFDKITSLVQSVLEVPICAVSLIDRERQWFKSIQGLEVKETARSISFCTHTIRGNQPFVVPDALEDACFRSNPLVTDDPNIRSYAGVPLRTPEGYNVGALCAIDTKPREFSPAQMGILASFASLVVDELELRRIAERDHLTGALTRRGFFERLKQQIAAYHRHGRNSALVLLDVDHFKSVNDRYGHLTGDEVLRAVSAVCSARLRATDLFGRIGGEEFGLLLTDTNAAGAMVVAEQTRSLIEAREISGIKVTASFGVAHLTSATKNVEDWIAEADDALYAAKRQGRNRCVLQERSSQVLAA